MRAATGKRALLEQPIGTAAIQVIQASWAEETATGIDQSLFVAARKSGLAPEFPAQAKDTIAPGTMIIFTENQVDPSTQSASGFQILVAQKN